MRIPSAVRVCVFAGLSQFVGTYGCKDLGVNGPDQAMNFHLTVVTPETVLGKPGHEVLHIISAKILLENISFRVSGLEDSTEITRGPLVVDLDLTARTKELLISQLPTNNYDRMRFSIHAPEDGEPLLDSAFVAGNDSSKRYSVVVVGLYHETPFTFRSQESFRIDINFTSPVAISASGSVNVTLKIDPYAWFTEGQLFYDPFNQTGKIDGRIKNAQMEAFRDNDRNGEPDDH
jgi:hypothetical protein